MASKTMATVQGYLSQDPRLNQTQQGQRVANVSVGYTPQKKTQNGYEDIADTTWFNVALWGDAANVAQGLQKGDEVVLTGSFHVETYDKKDGGQGINVVMRGATCALVESKQAREARQAARGGANGGGQGQWATPGQNVAQGDGWGDGQAFDAQTQQQWAQQGDEPPF